MTYDELVVKDVPNLPVDHPFYYLEDFLKRDTPLKKKEVHDKEHEDMLVKWGYNPEQTSRLTIRTDENGTAFTDRLYHIVLHLKYWKEEGLFLEATERFEKESGLVLEEIPLPERSGEATSAY